MKSHHHEEKTNKNIIVVGGGIAGVTTALRISKEGYNVTLIEGRSKLMQGTSNNTPCRVGAGLHYVDPNTAREYLKSTVAFLREYSGFLLKTETDLEGSDYAIVSDTLFDYGEIAPAHLAVFDEYKKLISEDIKNKVLGEPSDLIRFQPDIPGYIRKKVTLMRTAEKTLDWPALKKHLTSEISCRENINIILNQEVEKFINNYKDRCKVICKSGKVFSGGIIVNCTWQNIEKLNTTLGHFYFRKRTCRLKAMVEIALPEELKSIRTTFFCFGPHCSITNIGDGKAFLTYEPLTNVEKTTDIVMPKEIEYWSNYGTELSISKKNREKNKRSFQKHKLGIDIIENAGKYIKGIINATLINVSFGIVKNFGNADIGSKKSEHHTRAKCGVSSLELGVLVNASMKLLYGVSNSIKIESILMEHLKMEALLRNFLGKNKEKLKLDTTKKNAIYKYVTQYYNGFFHEEKTGFKDHMESICKLVEIKDKLLKEVHRNKAFIKRKL